MSNHGEKRPDKDKVEKELSDFLSKKFGDRVKIVSPHTLADEMGERTDRTGGHFGNVDFSLKPEDLTAYLDQYIVKQEEAKSVLATKICTHYNRVRRAMDAGNHDPEIVGGIKNNVLLLGPTGVGKTYMIKLVARRIGVPFVKGDATKFSETGYVGGDVEDLVRDLVREAEDDVDLAQYGIIYIDEIDKIASSGNVFGADVSRSGVQRALLKPMEETEVDLKVPHDPVSMIQEIERYRKTGKKDKGRINTKNILFIMSGAFSDLPDIIRKRVSTQGIGFGAQVSTAREDAEVMGLIQAQDLVRYGFESEFIGRLPVIAVLQPLSEDDLYDILKNPNNPIVLSKKLDFASYGIDIRFSDEALRLVAKEAAKANTGARGLVGAMEKVLLPYEKRLPSTKVKRFAVTAETAGDPNAKARLENPSHPSWNEDYRRVLAEETERIRRYISDNLSMLSDRFDLKLTPSRIDLAASLYVNDTTDVRSVLKRIREDYGKVKKLEVRFFQDQDVNIVLEEDAVDHVIREYGDRRQGVEAFYDELIRSFEYGLKLIREKTGRNRFFLTREALQDPEAFLSDLVKRSLMDTEGEQG
ncbi:MAG: AAA family ATPase [Desulfatibacillaceae bacterium]